MTSEMMIAALRSGADDLSDKPSVTNEFYAVLMRDSADRIGELERSRDYWQDCRNTLRKALIETLEARRDDEGKWIDGNGDYVDALNYVPTEAQEALKWEREADALRIGNGHLRDRIAQLEGKR